jgi:hypothetical protein
VFYAEAIMLGVIMLNVVAYINFAHGNTKITTEIITTIKSFKAQAPEILVTKPCTLATHFSAQ